MTPADVLSLAAMPPTNPSYPRGNVLPAAQPTKKFATVEQMGALAAVLTTDGAASITGAALPVDGGWTAQ